MPVATSPCDTGMFCRRCTAWMFSNNSVGWIETAALA